MRTNQLSVQRVFAVMMAISTVMVWGPVQAALLDDFNDNDLAGWRVGQLNFGESSAVVENGQVRMTTQAVPGRLQFVYLVYDSCEAPAIFTLRDGQTVEFRVDVISLNQNDAVAYLTFNLEGAYPFSSAYSVTKDLDSFRIRKDDAAFFRDGSMVKYQNVTLVLRLTGDGSDVILHALVLDKDDGDRVLQERSIRDTPSSESMAEGSDVPPRGYLGARGYFTMGLLHGNGNNISESVGVFDNAQVSVFGPTLSIEQDPLSSQARISWPATSTPFTLESTTNLNGLGDWQPVGIVPVQVDGENTVEMVPENPLEIFRLNLGGD